MGKAGTLLEQVLAMGIDGRAGGMVPLVDLTSYRIGGPAEVLVEPASIRDVALVVGLARRLGAPLAVLGGGSNVLVPDAGLPGITLRVAAGLAGAVLEGDVIRARAGTPDRDLANLAASAGMTGFEFLEDIPGTVGGGLVQNAEAWGDSISAHLLEVTFVEPSGSVRVLGREDLGFGYRDSTFKQEPGLVIVEAAFRPPGRDDPAAIGLKMDALREKRHSRYPLECPSCGSVFKRPAGDFAGRLIEQAGLGGLRCGNASVSRQHHNFIVNDGNATARDVLDVIERVRDGVEARFGVRLELELVLLGKHC